MTRCALLTFAAALAASPILRAQEAAPPATGGAPPTAPPAGAAAWPTPAAPAAAPGVPPATGAPTPSVGTVMIAPGAATPVAPALVGASMGPTIALAGPAWRTPQEQYLQFVRTLAGDQSTADPEVEKLLGLDREKNSEIAAVAARYKNLTDANERAAAEKQIADLVMQQFSLRQQLRERQLVQLEEQVKRLRAVQNERESQRDRIVADRVQQILREAAGLGWGDVGVDEAAAKFKFTTGAKLPVKIDGKRVFIRDGKTLSITGAVEPAPDGESRPEK